MQNHAHRPKFHIFNGKKYKIIWKKPDKDSAGACYSPDQPFKKRNILIAPSSPKEYRMEVMLHEALHAELWCLDEETVTRAASNITMFLQKCGVELKN